MRNTDIQTILKNVAKKLERAKVDSFEVVGLLESKLAIESKRQMVESLSRAENLSVAIRVVTDGRMGFGSTSNLDASTLSKLILQTVEAAGHTESSEESFLPFPAEPKGSFAEQVGRSFFEIPDEEKIKLTLAIESSAVAADNRIVRVGHPRYEERVWSFAVLSSTGISMSSSRSLAVCELKAIAEDKGSSEAAYEFQCSPRFEDLNVESIAKLAARRATAKLGAGPAPKGKYLAVFDTRAAASIIKLIAPSFFADNCTRGTSAIAKKMGERIYSPLVTIIDDGLLSGGVNSFPFDGEGIPKGRTYLAREGTVSSWLYDGARARLENKVSTGNSQRESIKRPPVIGINNCFMKAGQKKFEDIVRDITKGIFITELAGLHTANAITGDFSLGAEGFLIEGGALSRPVRGITVAGNVHELLKNVTGVADDLKFYGSTGAPSFAVEAISVAG